MEAGTSSSSGKMDRQMYDESNGSFFPARREPPKGWQQMEATNGERMSLEHWEWGQQQQRIRPLAECHFDSHHVQQAQTAQMPSNFHFSPNNYSQVQQQRREEEEEEDGNGQTMGTNQEEEIVLPSIKKLRRFRPGQSHSDTRGALGFATGNYQFPSHQVLRNLFSMFSSANLPQSAPAEHSSSRFSYFPSAPVASSAADDRANFEYYRFHWAKNELIRMLDLPPDQQYGSNIWLELVSLMDGRRIYHNILQPALRLDAHQASACLSTASTLLNCRQLVHLLNSVCTCTLIARRVPSDAKEEEFRQYFAQYGKMEHFQFLKARTNNRSRWSILVFVRMAKLEAQLALLQKAEHELSPASGRTFLLSLTFNRILLIGLPWGAPLRDLRSYFMERLKEMDGGGYLVEVYHPVPFKQFAFLSISGPPILGEALSSRTDLVLNGHPLTLVCTAPYDNDQFIKNQGKNEAAIENHHTVAADNNALIVNLFEAKLKEFSTAGHSAKCHSLLRLSQHIRLAMKKMQILHTSWIRTKKKAIPTLEGPNCLLDTYLWGLNQLNRLFYSIYPAELLTDYLVVQLDILDLCHRTIVLAQ